MKFVHQPTIVEALFQSDGTIRVQRFTWDGTWLDVTDVGRQWADGAGHHVLVMAAGRLTFELLLERETLAWKVVRAPEERRAA